MSHASKKKRSNGAKRGGMPDVVTRSAGRLIVTYLDGTWSDNLAVGSYTFEPVSNEVILAIEVMPRERPGRIRAARQALRDFVAKLGRIHTLQIGKPLLAEQLREQVRILEPVQIGVKLSAEGRNVAYPAGLVFGPDEITLNLG